MTAEEVVAEYRKSFSTLLQGGGEVLVAGYVREDDSVEMQVMAVGEKDAECSFTDLFWPAIHPPAKGLWLIHNHPHGALYPSKADKVTHKYVKLLSETLEVPLIGCLIVTEAGWVAM